MRLALAVLVLVFCLPSGVASAATVRGTYEFLEDASKATMVYRAGHGVANRVTIRPSSSHEFSESGALRITERAERLRARGDCKQVNRHTAICPDGEFTEFEVSVGSRDDRVELKGLVAAVHGGSGNDHLISNAAALYQLGYGAFLYGDGGRDTLRGGPGPDALHGGAGRDRFEGRGGATRLGDRFFGDIFYDDETDAQAARDVYIGGRNSSAMIDYSRRTRPLRIDLRRSYSGPERDIIRGVAGVTGGSGRDVLTGDGGHNALNGGSGNDRVYGRGGEDVLNGGEGDDLMSGGDGDDRLSEFANPDRTKYDNPDPPTVGGSDHFIGGRGVDRIRSLESLDSSKHKADEVLCDSRDAAVESDPADLLSGCILVAGWSGALVLWVQPELTADSATFTLRCRSTGCRGRLALTSVDGADFGSTTFQIEGSPNPNPRGEPGYGVPVKVTVPLTAAGQTALPQGAIVRVEADALSGDTTTELTGYRAFMHP